jgi:hypothetical protein
MFKNYYDYKQNRDKIKFKYLSHEYEKYDKNNKNEINIAIIIPHRNRIEHLEYFCDNIYKLKLKKNHSFDIYVIDQYNNEKFNRGILLNIGYNIAKQNYNYDRYIFHDVDSYPPQPLFDLYFQYINYNIHFASPYLDYKYKYDQFFGGVVGLTGYDFEKINGYPNTFFGWGGEDDVLLNRLIINKIPVYRIAHEKETSSGNTILYSGKSILSYILSEHDKPDITTINTNKQNNILSDLQNWKNDGVNQIGSYNILYKRFNYKTFIKKYDIKNNHGSFKLLTKYKKHDKENIYKIYFKKEDILSSIHLNGGVDNSDIINKLKNRRLNILDSIYKNINFDKTTQHDLIYSILNIKPTRTESYKTNLCIVNIFCSNKTSYHIIRENDLPRDGRVFKLKTFLNLFCKWIDNTHQGTNIQTCLLFYVSDRFVWHIKDVDKKLPICIYASPINFNYILIPDGDFVIYSDDVRYGNVGIDWEKQKELFIDDIEKKNTIFFKGADTTSFNHFLRSDIMNYLNEETDMEFKNAMKYEFLTKDNYESIDNFKQYKFLLNLPGRYPWSTRLKYLYLCKSYIINVRVTTKGSVNEAIYNSFIDVILPDSYCINIDMYYYYYDNKLNELDKKEKYEKLNKQETRKVYDKIKQIYYEYKDKNPLDDEKVQTAYNIVNAFNMNDMYEYFFKIMNMNYNIGLIPFRF